MCIRDSRIYRTVSLVDSSVVFCGGYYTVTSYLTLQPVGAALLHDWRPHHGDAEGYCEPLPSSVFSTLRAYSVCVVLVAQDFPQLLLANGTVTCVLVVVAVASMIAELRVNKQIHHRHFCGVGAGVSGQLPLSE